MGIEYTMFTEYKHNGKWYCIDPYALCIEEQNFKLIPTLSNHASRRFESVYNELNDIGYRINFEDLSENLRTALDELCLTPNNLSFAVDIDSMSQCCSRKPVQHSAFALRSEVRDFENHIEDDIYDYVDAGQYRVMDRELKKAYRYYEWNERFGWFDYFQRIQNTMREHLADFASANYMGYELNGELRLIVFIH